MPYTVTKVWTAKWWKRPLLWLIGKPTRTVDVYHNVEITNIEFSMDGEELTSKVEFKGKDT